MKNITLVKIAAVGGFLTCGMGFAVQFRLNNNVKKTTFYNTALNLVRHNKAAIHYLGEPIKDKSIDSLNSEKNYFRDGIGQFEVKLKGSKQNGTLYMFIEEDKVEGTEGWKLNRLELALDKEPERRLLIRTENLKINE